MSRRLLLFVVLAAGLALLFIRLGFWQLDRLQQRRAVNADVLSRLEQPAIPFDSLDPATDTAFRRVIVRGTPDTTREILHVGRSRNGSPGVHILTPLRRAGNDTAVLVNRGWVYAPDAATAETARWRERRVAYTGFVMPLSRDSSVSTITGQRVRQLSRVAVQALLPYPVAPLYVVAQDSGAVDSIPARLGLPALDNGPHLSYAIQWFFFAAIAIGGSVAVVVRSRTRLR